MTQKTRSPLKQHPAGHSVIDYRQWAEDTRMPQGDEDSPREEIKDRRFNDDPTEFYMKTRGVTHNGRA